jgi:hypothetical protein
MDLTQAQCDEVGADTGDRVAVELSRADTVGYGSGRRAHRATLVPDGHE